MSIVITCLHHLDVILCDSRFLGEFLFQEVGDQGEVTVEEPADQSEGEHITAFQDRLVVHACVSQTILDHRRQRALDDTVGVDTHLAQVILTLKLCFLQVFGTEGVCVDDNRCLWL